MKTDFIVSTMGEQASMVQSSYAAMEPEGNTPEPVRRNSHARAAQNLPSTDAEYAVLDNGSSAAAYTVPDRRASSGGKLGGQHSGNMYLDTAPDSDESDVDL